ncbi:MAG: caa(3)-type oxidase, subunit [Phycisphaerales bacterium]|nr:caa(3)-type oxidase, subunit [Phycisphaerales bacterium]
MAHANDFPDADHGHVRAADSHHGHDPHDHGTGLYWIVFLALAGLMIATVLVSYINMGHFNVPVAYGIASLKAALILWFFMHLNRSTRLTQVFAFASFVWLGIFLIMTLGDYISRNMVPRAQAQTMIRKVDSYDVVSGSRHNKLDTVGPEEDLGVQERANTPGVTEHKNH